MSLLYKLTTADLKTRKGESNETTWGEGVTHSGDTTFSELCSPGFIHAYTHPLLAVLLNPVHADIPDPVLWECEGEGVISDRGLKVGCRRLTTVRRIPLPSVSTEQRVRFAILCGKAVCSDPQWLWWADGWLDGRDRTGAAARAAKAKVKAREAEAAAAREAEAREAEAWAAAAAAEAAEAAEAREAEAWAEAAAAAEAWAAAAAAAADLDLITLALEAVQ
jgi:hypothetical protein